MVEQWGGKKEADAEREMGRNAGRIAKGAKTTGPELGEWDTSGYLLLSCSCQSVVIDCIKVEGNLLSQ